MSGTDWLESAQRGVSGRALLGEAEVTLAPSRVPERPASESLSKALVVGRWQLLTDCAVTAVVVIGK